MQNEIFLDFPANNYIAMNFYVVKKNKCSKAETLKFVKINYLQINITLKLIEKPQILHHQN